MPFVSPTTGNAAKPMSTRLLTMKFMQRAAASPTASAPIEESEPSLKRRRRDPDGTQPRQKIEALSDQNAVLDALAKEEEKSLAALDKLASACGDTRWVIDYQEHDHPVSDLSLRVVHIGYAGLDETLSQCPTADKFDDKPVAFGRRSFGRFNRLLEKQQNINLDQSSESDSDKHDKEDTDSSESENSDDDDDPTSHLIKSARREVAKKLKIEHKSKRRETKTESDQLKKKRKKEDEISLYHLTSLSGRQEAPARTQIECYSCGGPHRKSDCPKRKRGQHYIDDGFPRKAFKLG